MSDEPDRKRHRALKGGISIDFPNLRRNKETLDELLVPKSFTFSDVGRRIGLLTFEQHSKRNQTHFYPEQLDELNKMGFVWNVFEHTWNELDSKGVGSR